MKTIILFTLITFAMAQDEFTESKPSLGGYGELHLTIVDKEGEATKTTADFHRFVLFYGYNFNENWSFKSEVELEHNFVNDGHGELELEQAYVDYHRTERFAFRVGVILAPVGILNELHEPPTFFGVERPSYSKYIIPTTWFDNGFSIYGILNKQVSYNLSVMGGLDGDDISKGLRSARSKGFKSDLAGYNFNNPTFITRVDFIGVEGLRTGVSYMLAKARRMTGIAVSTNLLDFHLKYDRNNVHAKAQYGMLSLDKDIVAFEGQVGILAELGYNVLGGDKFLAPFFRYEDISRREGHIVQASEDEKHSTIITLGVNYKPLDQIVFKFDYSSAKTKEDAAKAVHTIAFGAGYMF